MQEAKRYPTLQPIRTNSNKKQNYHHQQPEMISWHKLSQVVPKEINKILGIAQHKSFSPTGDKKQM